MISSRQHSACPSQRQSSKDREVGRVTGPRWEGDKCGLNLLIYISYSLLSQGASEELECDSWKGLQRQFYPRAQDEIIPLTWSMARATTWGSPSILGPGPWRLRSGEVDSLPGTLAFILRFYCYGWFQLMPPGDSTHSRLYRMPYPCQPGLCIQLCPAYKCLAWYPLPLHHLW